MQTTIALFQNNEKINVDHLFKDQFQNDLNHGLLMNFEIMSKLM